MARPNKFRRICRMPGCMEFSSKNITSNNSMISLSVEEYETIRLIDYLGFTQEECAKQMQVGRATVQSIYLDARKKIARFIVEGANLEISGGNYEICESGCSQKDCRNLKCEVMKGDKRMKIAVTYSEGKVFQHFGHSEQFKLYEVENNKVVSSEVVDTNGSGHGALAGFLKDHDVNVLICGGIGGGAKNALSQAGIDLYPGAVGDADSQVDSFLKGNLSYDPNTQCSHHSHEEGHTCGEHGCGNH